MTAVAQRVRVSVASRRLLGVGLALLVSVAVSGCHAAASSTPLTPTDVQAVLASMDTTTSMLADYKVDVPRFAASIVGQLPIYLDSTDSSSGPTTFLTPDSTSLKAMTPAEASSTVTQALAVYHRVVSEEGTAAADIAMITGPASDAPASLSTQDQNLLGLLQEGATRLTFMFGQPDPKQWTWTPTYVAILGPDTAEVTYSAATPSGKPFRFTTPRFAKRLHFERRADGVWVLDGWLDYPRFESAVKNSIKPSDEIPDLVPNWWDTLGAD